MSNKKLINSYPNLETLPLDDLYNSNITEYRRFYEYLFSDFFEEHTKFSEEFGFIMYNLSHSEWFYCLPRPNKNGKTCGLDLGEKEIDELSKKSEEDGVDYFYEIVKKQPCDFDIGFLSKKEIDELLEKSEKEGINYLYEKVKDHEYKPYYDPDCVY